MSDVDLIDECVKSLAKIYNYSYDKVNKLLLKGVIKRWDLDENALGAFVMFNPFQVSHYLLLLLGFRLLKSFLFSNDHRGARKMNLFLLQRLRES